MFRRSLSLIWPDDCPLCGNPLHKNDSAVCFKCLASLPNVASVEPLTYVGDPSYPIKLYSWFVYNTSDVSHKLLYDIKYNDKRNLARKLGRELAMQSLTDAPTIDIILPIPLHWTKFLRRSYNQSYEIALGIKDILNIQVGKNLYASRNHKSQAKTVRSERLLNVNEVFDVKKSYELDNKHIAILDDIFTTGATMFSALDAILKKSKPASVTFISLARTGS